MINERWLRKRYLKDKAPVVAIAEAAGVHPSTVYRALDRYEIPRRGKPGTRTPRLNPKRVAEQRSDGLTWHRIGALAGADRSSVVWHAAQHGLYDLADDPRRYRRAVRAAEKYRRGQSIASIAATVGVNKRHVTIWLRALGVQIRRPGRPPATNARRAATARATSRKAG